MTEFNPFCEETTYTNQELAADIKEELARLEGRREYLIEMLGELTIEDFSNLSADL